MLYTTLAITPTPRQKFNFNYWDGSNDGSTSLPPVISTRVSKYCEINVFLVVFDCLNSEYQLNESEIVVTEATKSCKHQFAFIGLLIRFVKCINV